MGFKLLRIDTEKEPLKISLPLGTHLIGRGNFLDCEDKRVSRNHSELEVTDDSVKIKSLHQNPCFYIRKGTDETQLLKLNCITELSNGDRFGLLPHLYWYELMYCTQADGLSPEEANPIRVVNTNSDDTVRIEKNTECLNDSQEPLNFELNENADNERPESPTVRQGAESPSLVQPRSPSYTQNEPPSVMQTENQQSLTHEHEAAVASENSEQPQATLKRSHSPDPIEAKKVKTEPAEVKQEPDDVKPGPSNNQGASKADDNGSVDPAPPANPAGPGRERCMYGANCYRKNPEHKAQFSHPCDADWGPGARGACPWGRGCRRADPRHWRDHDHPAGTVQPPPGARPAGKKKRKQSCNSSEDDTPVDDLIVTGKRQRKTVQRQGWSGSESENDDPFQTDESGEDEWQPGSDKENTQSQGYTQDL